MNNKLRRLVLIFLLVPPTLLACTKTKEDIVTKSKDNIKKMTDQVADQAVEKMRSPLEKAKEMANTIIPTLKRWSR